MDIRDIADQIKQNCNISDSRSWGYYSICGLLMRMRELYRHEHGLGLWQPVGNEALEWVAAREALWQELIDRDFEEICINGKPFGPFSVDAINEAVNRDGYVYGGGYGMFHKPTFFLARIEEERNVEGFRAFFAGRELCRDISASPAMLQGKNIFIRHEPLRAILWDKFIQLKGRKFGGTLAEAFSVYGISGSEEPSEELFGSISRISASVAEILLRHEIGEAVEDDDADEWFDILHGNTDKFLEVHLRGIKDLIADTSEAGPLRWIAGTRNRSLLNFYMVLLDGVRKELFPEMRSAFQEFVDRGEWEVIEKARESGYARARELSEEILALWRIKGSTEDVTGLIRRALGGSHGFN